MTTAATTERLTKWLESYKRAWEQRDADAAADLFTENGVYAWGPFEEPMRGRDAIRTRWAEVTAAQRDVEFGFELLGTVEAGAVARWWCTFAVEQLRIELNGIFLVVLTEDGLCSDFREWWNERTSDVEA
jgi:ketosteroid isomerase-like protein